MNETKNKLSLVTDEKTLTPMMRQYYALKAQAGDAILFFRMGDFYEVFGEDADLVAPALEIVLTSREKGDQTRIPFCGVPHHAARHYWLKLLKLGHKVAIADQVEDPKMAKGIVRREITRFMTPGCTDDLEALDRESPNYLCAILEDPQTLAWAVCFTDMSTGDLRLGSCASWDDLQGLILKFQPKELLVRKFQADEVKLRLEKSIDLKVVFSTMPESILRDQNEQRAILNEVFAVTALKDLPCGQVAYGMELVAGLLTHFKAMKQPLGQFRTAHALFASDTMRLDDVATRDLELFETIRRRQHEGSLYREINCTLTPMGARLLRRYLAEPLLKKDQIQQRQAAVSALVKAPAFLQTLRAELCHAGDMDRLLTRVVGGSAHPHELVQIRALLRKAQGLSTTLRPFSTPGILSHNVAVLARKLNALSLLESSLLDQPNQFGEGDKVFRQGFHQGLDELCTLARNSNALIQAYENKLREETSINSLKIKQHKSFGLLIEITKSNLGKVPKHFIRRQTMVNNERFVTEELNLLNEKLATAIDQICILEQALYGDLLKQVALEKEALQDLSAAIASLDVMQSFAWKAQEERWTCPKTSDNGTLHLIGSRHPVVERFIGKHQFTVNDISMDGEHKHFLITGPNMGGKSTIMRQCALIAILHQIGSCVPASEAELPIFDSVYTRVGASDDLAKGQSTFLIEMLETARILKHATSQSLVILDEVGRGTSTSDGRAIAAAVFEELATRIKCYTLFATHYHELVDIAQAFGGVYLKQTEVVQENGSIKFTHRLVPGSSACSYGIDVAKIAGLPSQVISHAQKYLSLGEAPIAATAGPSLEFLPTPVEAAFAVDVSSNRLKEVSDRLLKLRIHRTTPLQALNILNDLKLIVEAPDQISLFD